MIDWPNLIAGFLIGLVPTLTLWLVDRHRAKRTREREARDGWNVAAKTIESLLYKPDTTSVTLYDTVMSYPIDTWRAILGPDEFRALEAVQNAYARAEFCVNEWKNSRSPETQAAMLAAGTRCAEAVTLFANLSRGARSAAYDSVVRAEARKQLKGSYLRYPVKTWRRERHNRAVRRASAGPPA
jgi:hypothetical protein